MAHPAPARPALLVHLLAALALIAAAWLVFHGALAYFFAQDDFAGLARARGVLPPLATPWRWLAGQGYFELMRAIADLRSGVYHAASLGVHAAAAVLLYRVLVRFTSWWAALAGAACFATHPAAYTALYSVSGIGELMSLLFALATLALLLGSRARWLAVPAFALSLACKESTLLLPLALLAVPRLRRDRMLVALGVVSVAWMALLWGLNVFDVRTGVPGQAAYALQLDGTVLANLLTYAGWTIHIALPTVHSYSDAIDPREYAWGAVALLVWLAGLASPGLRARGWGAGGAWYAALLLPVLPLGHHSYHYYLYGPLAGVAWCVAAGLDAAAARNAFQDAARRRPAAPRAWAPAAAIGLAVLVTANGAVLVRTIETHPLGGDQPGHRADATVDRALIAARVAADVRAAALPEGTRLAFWSPIAHGDAPEDAASYWERNVQSAIFDGIGVRVVAPQVREVRFESAFRPLPDPWRWAVYRPDGALRIATSEELARVLPRFVPGAVGAADTTARPGG